MKIAIVHYWLVDMRGGERVLEALCDLFPQADVVTNVYRPSAVSPKIRAMRVIPTFVDRLPFSARARAAYLPLMPIALEQVDLRAYDFVISLESGPAKGILPRLDAPHLCYCLSPMRYAWDHYQDALDHSSALQRLVMRPAMHYLRAWDQASAARVDRFATISRHVQRRVSRWYRRRSDIVHPPVRVSDFSPASKREDYFLYVGEFVPYKRPDLALRACEQLGLPLVMIGRGPMERELRRLAGRNVRILGWQPDEVVRDHMSRCRALLFPGEEDFGLTPVECAASGAPVVAYGSGGILDIVEDGVNGILFGEQSVEGLVAGIRRFMAMPDFSPEAMQATASRFDVAVFNEKFLNLVANTRVGFHE